MLQTPLNSRLQMPGWASIYRESPEQRLIRRVLEQSLRDFWGATKARVRKQKLYAGESPAFMLHDLEHWFSLDTPNEPFSFSWLCEQLFSDGPDAARRIRHLLKITDARRGPRYELFAIACNNFALHNHDG